MAKCIFCKREIPSESKYSIKLGKTDDIKYKGHICQSCCQKIERYCNRLDFDKINKKSSIDVIINRLIFISDSELYKRLSDEDRIVVIFSKNIIDHICKNCMVDGFNWDYFKECLYNFITDIQFEDYIDDFKKVGGSEENTTLEYLETKFNELLPRIERAIVKAVGSKYFNFEDWC